jgi:hypothetical protein
MSSGKVALRAVIEDHFDCGSKVGFLAARSSEHHALSSK